MITEQREIAYPVGLGLQHRHGRAGHRGLEAETEKNHFAIRVLTRQLERVQRRINHAHISAVGLGLKQTFLRTRHAHRVAKGSEDNLRLLGQRHTVVHAPHRQYTYRAAGTVHELNRCGKQLLNTVAKYGMGVPTAHLHDLQWPVAGAFDPAKRDTNLIDQRARFYRIAEFVNILHIGFPRLPRASASSVCTRSQRM